MVSPEYEKGCKTECFAALDVWLQSTYSRKNFTTMLFMAVAKRRYNV
jgi:hypothetical protein